MGLFWILLVALAVSLIPGKSEAELRRLNLSRAYPVVEAENHVYIGTPNGFYQYNAADDAYKRFVVPGAGPNSAVRELYYSDEWLWCILDDGLAALHIRLNEWLYFDAESGLPSNAINGLSFQEDYVWVATDRWAARYDLFIEEWELYDETLGVPDSSVNDVVAIGDNVWVITDRLFSEYDSRFEKWRHHALREDTTAMLERGFVLGDELYLVGSAGLTRFDTALQTQQTFTQAYLRPENLLEIMVEDNTIWVFTRLGIYHYDRISEVWREFEANSYLESSVIASGYVGRSEIWVFTGDKVLVWNRAEKTWEILDYASGLSYPRYESAYVRGGTVFLLNPQGIDYRMTEGGMWRAYSAKPVSGGPGVSGRDILRNLFDNEEGGYLQIGRYRWGWEGTRMTYVYDYRQRYDNEGRGLGADVISGERFDIKSRLAVHEQRVISGFYNNIDYSETMYGIRYRSRAEDFLRELNWGDFRRESPGTPFTETASVFGSDIWLQAGSKTPRFKRSYATLKGLTGERRSQKTYEVFAGAHSRSELLLRDTDYLKNQIFTLPGLDTLGYGAGIEIYLDDLEASNNSPNTLEAARIAGIVGDYDLLRAPGEYYLYERSGTIRFLRFISGSWTIVARVTAGGEVHEEVLQYGGAITTSARNHYYLGGREMIPYSLELVIWDDLGSEIPLSDFGLDRNGDGFVDSEHMDYGNGMLIFPDSEPFPPPVYDPDDPRSYYVIYAGFDTKLPLIQLAHKNLVRGAEVLKLDGIAAEGGNDYVLDYTNGTLVFVREGIVNADTRIEVEYEYLVTENNTRMHGALLNLSPSDNLYVQADWLQFTPTPGGGPPGDETSNILSLHGEVRQTLGDYDLRVIPGVSYQAEGNEVSGGYAEALLSSSAMRFQTKFSTFTEGYSNLYRPQFVLGDVKSDMDAYLTFDARHDLRLTASYRDVKGFGESRGAAPADRSGLLGFLFHREKWPGWEFTYQTFRTEGAEESIDRYFFENRFEYRPPHSVCEKILLDDLRLEALLRSGRQSGEEKLTSAEQEFHQGFIRLNANISDRFQSGLFYRRNDLKDASPGAGSSPMTRAERMLFNLSHEEWRILQANLRIENTLDRGFHRGSPLSDVLLNQYSQIDLRFSPGAAWSPLSPLYFEFNINQSLRGWGTAEGEVNTRVWRVFSFDTGDLDDSQLLRNYYVRNEIRPSPAWFLHSMIEWNDGETQFGGSTITTGYWRWSERLDFKVGYNTRFNLRYKLHSEDYGYARSVRYHEPSAWVEHRLTRDLLNTFYALYRRTDSDDGKIRDVSDDIEGRYDFIWRKERFIGLRRLELRQTFSGSHSRTDGCNIEKTYDITSSTGVDLVPIYSMILRFQVNLTRHLDQIAPGNDYSRVAFIFRTSLRF